MLSDPGRNSRQHNRLGLKHILPVHLLIKSNYLESFIHSSGRAMVCVPWHILTWDDPFGLKRLVVFLKLKLNYHFLRDTAYV